MCASRHKPIDQHGHAATQHIEHLQPYRPRLRHRIANRGDGVKGIGIVLVEAERLRGFFFLALDPGKDRSERKRR